MRPFKKYPFGEFAGSVSYTIDYQKFMDTLDVNYTHIIRLTFNEIIKYLRSLNYNGMDAEVVFQYDLNDKEAKKGTEILHALFLEQIVSCRTLSNDPPLSEINVTIVGVQSDSETKNDK